MQAQRQTRDQLLPHFDLSFSLLFYCGLAIVSPISPRSHKKTTVFLLHILSYYKMMQKRTSCREIGQFVHFHLSDNVCSVKTNNVQFDFYATVLYLRHHLQNGSTQHFSPNNKKHECSRSSHSREKSPCSMT